MKRLFFVLLASFSFSVFAQGETHLSRLAAERKVAYEQKSAEEKAALSQEITEQQKAKNAYQQRTAEQNLWQSVGYLLATVGEIASGSAE